MPLAPKSLMDLALAPIAARVDLNLQRLRGRSPEGVEYELQLELDRAPIVDDRAERASRVLTLALRDVEMHGWDAEITEDGSAIRLTGGSVTLDIAVGANVTEFVAGPLAKAAA